MKDIPFFTTETGVSSLLLKEIPYRNTAYIRVGNVQPGGLEEHLRQCVSFCRMAGADRIFATGHAELEAYPVYTSVLGMQGTAFASPEKVANLFPVTEETVGRWRQIYNEAMYPVDNAATLESRDEKQLLQSTGAYFIHRGGTLLGIGWLEDRKLLAVASVQKGMGEVVMHTLMSLAEGAEIQLEVAATNEKALNLYEKLGFLATGEICRWYDVK